MLFDTGLALSVFVATDIDDLLLLAAFFGDRRLSPRSIVAGQFAGIAMLVLVSALGARLAFASPPGWGALLGLVPLGMGLMALKNLRNDDADDEVEDGLAAERRAEQRVHSQLLAVALVTIANGGDNLGAYIPLFARNPDNITLYTLLFGAMTALWCALAWWLVRHRRAGLVFQRYGSAALSFVLIALGLVILADARVLFH